MASSRELSISGSRMSAKQRTTQKVKQRLQEKLLALENQEETLYTILHNYVHKAKCEARSGLSLEDSGLFLQQYGNIEQLLDRVFNTCELLTASLEDMIESGGDRIDLDSERAMTYCSQLLSSAQCNQDHSSLNATVTEEAVSTPEKKEPEIDITGPTSEEKVNNIKHAAEETSLSRSLEQQIKVENKEFKAHNANKTDEINNLTVESVETSDKANRQQKLESARTAKEKGSGVDQTDASGPDVYKVDDSGLINMCKMEKRDETLSRKADVKFATCVPDSVKEKFNEGINSSFEEQKYSGKGIKASGGIATDESSEIDGNSKTSLESREIVKSRSGKGMLAVETSSSEQPSPKKSKKNKKIKKSRKKSGSEHGTAASVNISVSEEPPVNIADNGEVSEKTVRNGSIVVEAKGQEVETVPEKTVDELNTGTLVKKVSDNDKITEKETIVNDQGSTKNIISIETSCTYSPPVIKKIVLRPSFLPSGRITQVVISEILSPWCFFVNRSGEQLPDLMQRINAYTADPSNTDVYLPHPKAGSVCLARFSKDTYYYRAYILQTYIAGSDTTVSEVDVLYVDYGNRERLRVTALRPLPGMFTLLPTQAICCALAEVMPGNRYCEWAESSTHTFSQLTMGNQQLTCTVACPSRDPAIPVLVDLVVSYPVQPTVQQSFVMSQIRVSTLLVNAGAAKPVSVIHQVGLMSVSGDWEQDADILRYNIALELGAAQESSQTNKSDTDKNMLENDISSDKKDGVKQLTSKGNPGGPISPQSEASETESQQTELNKRQVQGGTLGGIMEEADQTQMEQEIRQEVERSELASESSVSDLDFLTGIDLKLTDLKFDLDDSNLNPQGQEVMLAYIGSPGEFFVHIISQKSAHTLDKLMMALNRLFEKANRRKLTKLSKTYEPEIGKLCCAQFTQDDNFYRGVVKSLTPKNQIAKGRVLIHYIDFGDEEWLPKRRVFPLPAQFAEVPRMALRCCLAYIQPCSSQDCRATGSEGDSREQDSMDSMAVNGEQKVDNMVEESGKSCKDSEDEDIQEWPENAIKKFKDIAGNEKTVTMHIVQGNLADQKNSSLEDASCSLKVLLVDNTGTEEVCINMDLIQENLAQLANSQTRTNDSEATPLFVPEVMTEHATDQANSQDSRKALPSSQELPAPVARKKESNPLEKWNPMEDDFLSRRNNYEMDVDDVGVATTGYKARDEMVCKFYSSGRRCWKGDRCRFKHIAEVSGVTNLQEEVYAICDHQEEILPDPGSWVAMDITTIISPGRFYTILPMGKGSLNSLSSGSSSRTTSVFEQQECEETLDDLLSSLNTEYSNKSTFHTGSEYLRALGEIVVARYSQDSQWYRARIVEVDEEKVKVFYVDFGNTEWLADREVCDIKPEFLHLPFQALECFLTSIAPAHASNTWPKEASQFFRELVDGKTLVAHVKSRLWNGPLMVELFDTSEEVDINISKRLVEEGYASVVEDTQTDISCSNSEAGSVPREVFIPG
ncbi:uncharacterized protein LOC128217691 isoform X2 [Mya arenaria]|uniref:uncharacterized protein LOC128217691 isoform X2 n=1 Tax=Mya arenaria TaxID=6604 RepID=UPI0022E37621|nr:uncharacterized protein LOC128217691 isoform X2 [Mya arenaria]